MAPDGQPSWDHLETSPSTDAAANEIWASIAESVGKSNQGAEARYAQPGTAP